MSLRSAPRATLLVALALIVFGGSACTVINDEHTGRRPMGKRRPLPSRYDRQEPEPVEELPAEADEVVVPAVETTETTPAGGALAPVGPPPEGAEAKPPEQPPTEQPPAPPPPADER